MLPQPVVSKQLAILREGNLMAVRRDGRRRLYKARPEELRKMRAWLDRYGGEWSARLDALEDHLDRT